MLVGVFKTLQKRKVTVHVQFGFPNVMTIKKKEAYQNLFCIQKQSEH